MTCWTEGTLLACVVILPSSSIALRTGRTSRRVGTSPREWISCAMVVHMSWAKATYCVVDRDLIVEQWQL
jgi:hypothetical protein